MPTIKTSLIEIVKSGFISKQLLFYLIFHQLHSVIYTDQGFARIMIMSCPVTLAVLKICRYLFKMADNDSYN